MTSPATEEVALLPCAHCGGEGRGPGGGDTGDRSRSEYYWIECTNCPAGVEVFSTSARMAKPADAVAAWNRRAPEPGGWQPIATAPTDCTKVVLRDARNRPYVGFYDAIWYDLARGGMAQRMPTEWYPLPTEQPETKGGGA